MSRTNFKGILLLLGFLCDVKVARRRKITHCNVRISIVADLWIRGFVNHKTYRDGDLGRLLRGIAIGVQTCMVTAHIRIQIDLIASRNRSPREPILILPVEVESSLAVLAESETHAVQILWNSTDGAVPDAFVDGAALTLFWTTDGAQRREVY